MRTRAGECMGRVRLSRWRGWEWSLDQAALQFVFTMLHYTANNAVSGGIGLHTCGPTPEGRVTTALRYQARAPDALIAFVRTVRDERTHTYALGWRSVTSGVGNGCIPTLEFHPH